MPDASSTAIGAWLRRRRARATAGRSLPRSCGGILARAGRGHRAVGRRAAARRAVSALSGPAGARGARPRPRSPSGRRPPWWPIRTVPPRRPSRRFGSAASRSWTSPPTSASTASATSAGTSRTTPPSSSTAPSTASPRRTATRSAAPTWSPLPAAIRPPRCSPSGRSASTSRTSVVDAKSGVSGAGRDATADHALRLRHRERPGLQGRGPPPRRRARAGAERHRRFTFVPHLVPVEQGLLASCYVTTEPSEAEVTDLYGDAYEDEPFIDLVDEPPGTDDVRETNRCRIHVKVVGERVIALAAIDNLWKGAAGQAVQDLNLMLASPRRRDWNERERRPPPSSARAGWSGRREREGARPARAARRLPGGRGGGWDQARAGSTWAWSSRRAGHRRPPPASRPTRGWGRR